MSPEFGATDDAVPDRRRDARLPAPHRPPGRRASTSSSATPRRRACGASPATVPSSTPPSSSTSATVEPSARRARAARRTASRSAACRDNFRTAYPHTVGVARQGRSTARGETARDRPRVGGDRGHHLLHQHLQPDGDGRRRAARPQRRRPGPAQSRRSSRPRSPRARGRSPATSSGPGSWRRSRTSASRSPATAARPASATPGRSTSRSRRRSRPTSWSSRPSCRATATSRAASTRSCGPRTSPRRRSSSRIALAGRVDIDLTTEPLGTGSDGAAGHARRHLADARTRSGRSSATSDRPGAVPRRPTPSVFEGDERWRRSPIPEGDRYAWDEASTYIANPPFFEGLTARARAAHATSRAPARSRVLGDSVTTDHISPAGSIAAWSPAGAVAPGARRRAARLQLVRRPPRPPRGDDARHVRQHPAAQPRSSRARRGRTRVHLPDGEETFIYDAAMRYRDEGVPLVIIAGKEYGSGSSRDWAAKGTTLLGIRAVIAESYERIHRSNLVGHGRAAAPVPARRERRVAGPDRPRGVHDRRPGGPRARARS